MGASLSLNLYKKSFGTGENFMSQATRQRRKRERQKRDEMVVQIVVRRRSRDALVDARWIGEWDEDNREAVQAALQMLVDGIRTDTRDASR